MASIAIYGGTFDPVHLGHIATALSIQKYFHFDEWFFLPCKEPLIKPNSKASAEHRIQMLKIALRDFSQFQIDTCEIDRSTPSRMYETLETFRKKYPDDSLTLVMGMDTFASLPQWYQWEKLIELANFLVMYRKAIPMDALPKDVVNLLDKSQTGDRDTLLNAPHGRIMQIDAGHFDIASREIRKMIQAGVSVQSLLDPEVYTYIQENGLYV